MKTRLSYSHERAIESSRVRLQWRCKAVWSRFDGERWKQDGMAIDARIPKFTATDRDLVRPWLRTLNLGCRLEA